MSSSWSALVSGVCFLLLHTSGLIWFLSGVKETVGTQSQAITTLVKESRDASDQRKTLEIAIVQQKEILSTVKATVDAASIDRYRGSDAARDFKLVDLTIKSLTQRLEILEKNVDKLQSEKHP